MAQHIEIHIDKITLEGFDPADPRAIQRILREHLADILAREGLPLHTGGDVYVDRIRVADLTLPSPAQASDIGKGIARVIAGEIQPGRNNGEQPLQTSTSFK
jgi:hypothetical protein